MTTPLRLTLGTCGRALRGSALALGVLVAACDGPAAHRSASRTLGEAEQPRQIYYQFVDANGAVRFSPTLEAVPAEWRTRVGFVELASPPPLSPAEARRLRERSAGPPSAGGAAGREAAAAPTVILYGAQWCGACRMAKQFLDQRGIEYVERDVDEEPWKQEMLAKAGPGGIPVIDVGGQILRGFSPDRLEALLHGA